LARSGALRRARVRGRPFWQLPAWRGAWPSICLSGRRRGRGGSPMARIVIIGAGVVGLGAGLVLCGNGHEVTVVERDAQAPPAGAEEIWGIWQRKGVSKFRLPHFFLARYRGLLDCNLPEVKKVLIASADV